MVKALIRQQPSKAPKGEARKTTAVMLWFFYKPDVYFHTQQQERILLGG